MSKKIAGQESVELQVTPLSHASLDPGERLNADDWQDDGEAGEGEELGSEIGDAGVVPGGTCQRLHAVAER
jgi:hypothetical protein